MLVVPVGLVGLGFLAISISALKEDRARNRWHKEHFARQQQEQSEASGQEQRIFDELRRKYPNLPPPRRRRSSPPSLYGAADVPYLIIRQIRNRW
ncbi:hypothetical protein NONI108955_06165 [Nocardia ninae]|uniref:Uncharacterized protein n=1 Tax=Nocardia ninae NBRC 108245 TaxID=1210091 RepID=A0A511MLC8_9NOCA|nr:hypothetical protein NN4_54660 [Nocardia ninae NBRC 108245]